MCSSHLKFLCFLILRGKKNLFQEMVGGWAFFPLSNMHPSKGKVSYIETRKEATVSGVLQKR